jgi:hypothetical protein
MAPEKTCKVTRSDTDKIHIEFKNPINGRDCAITIGDKRKSIVVVGYYSVIIIRYPTRIEVQLSEQYNEKPTATIAIFQLVDFIEWNGKKIPIEKGE